MNIINRRGRLILLVDIDDLLVRSSDKLQDVLNNETNFKTGTLRMLEQLNRNCRYFYNQVEKECSLARIEGRKPRLDMFPYIAFNGINIYNEPLKVSKIYLNSAIEFLNQFLEERDTFLEIDNLKNGDIKKFNYRKESEKLSYFAHLYYTTKNGFHMINEYALSEARRISIDAKNNDMFPNYGALVSMDSNDIIKTNSIRETEMYKERILFEKPINDIEETILLEKCLYDIVTNGTVFITPSREIVDYSKIHTVSNVNKEAAKLIKKIIHSGMVDGVFFSTHHNGDREEKAKISLMKEILPETTGFIGQRFHDVEHNVERRGRSSKASQAIVYLERLLGFKIIPEQLILLDDSKANCKDIKERKGTEILYKPRNDSEIINGKLEEMGYNRILTFDEYPVFQYINNASNELEKVKTKRLGEE